MGSFLTFHFKTRSFTLLSKQLKIPTEFSCDRSDLKPCGINQVTRSQEQLGVQIKHQPNAFANDTTVLERYRVPHKLQVGLRLFDAFEQELKPLIQVRGVLLQEMFLFELAQKDRIGQGEINRLVLDRLLNLNDNRIIGVSFE